MAEELDLSRPTFVSYIERTRAYYLEEGYGNPYRYAFHRDVPFTPLPRPLGELRLGLVTTSMSLLPDGETRRPKRVYAQALEPRPASMYTGDLAWARESTHMEDVGAYLPIGSLRAWESRGRIGTLSSRFYGLPTEHAQRLTREADAPELLSCLREDGVEVALLVPI